MHTIPGAQDQPILVTTLPVHQRAVRPRLPSTVDRVAARAREGLSPGEIAEELGIHKSSVSRHLKKARELGQLPPGP